MHGVLMILAVVWASSAVGVFCLFRKEMRAQDLPQALGPLSASSVRCASDGHLPELGTQNPHVALVHAEECVEDVAD